MGWESINDFDETLPGPFEWDVERLVASFTVTGRGHGLDAHQRASLNVAVSRSYREAMASFARMRAADVWYARLDIEKIHQRWAASVSRAKLKQFERTIAKARAKDSVKAFKKLTHVVDGQHRIIADPPLIVPIEDLAPADAADDLAEHIASLHSYRHTLSADRRRLLDRFRCVHVARKVVGVGSVGARTWIVLMIGNDGTDPLFLQFKEAEASVLEPFLGKSGFANHGQRVVEGQRLMQSTSDVLLGWFRTAGIDGVERDYYLRQLWDSKGSLPIEAMSRRGLTEYADACAWTLARAHARSGDPVAIASYLGASDTFDQAMASFAERYADQNERDFAALRDAVEAGRVTAHTVR